MNLAMVTASKAHKHSMGPPGQCSTQSSVMNLAMVNASKPDKHCIGPYAVLAVGLGIWTW